MEIFLIGLIIAYIIALVINTVAEWRSRRTMEVMREVYERQNEFLELENKLLKDIIVSTTGKNYNNKSEGGK